MLIYLYFSTKYIHSKIIKIISFMLFQFRSSLFIILLMVELTGRLLGRSHSRIFMPDLHCIIIMPANVCPTDTPSSFTPMSKFIFVMLVKLYLILNTHRNIHLFPSFSVNSCVRLNDVDTYNDKDSLQ
jgi:hypothetical protein